MGNGIRRLSLVMFSLWVILTVGEIWWRVTSHQQLPVLGVYAAIPLWLFCVAHVIAAKGLREGLLLAGTALVFGTAAELAGLRGGLDHYSALLGPKIGPLPVIIPIAWLGSLYPAFVVVDLIAEHATAYKIRQAFGNVRGIGWAIFLTLTTAVMGTTYDLGLDPPMVAAGVWTFKIPGPYYNVPFQNYAGWLLIISLAVLPPRLYAMSRPQVPPRGWFALLPLGVYAGTMAAAMVDCFLMGLPVPAMVLFFAQGGCLVAAITQLVRRVIAPPAEATVRQAA